MTGTIKVDTERLRRLRRERAISQRALAQASGVGLDTVNKVETGVRDALPTTLQKLAGALGVEPSELMKEDQARAQLRAQLLSQSESKGKGLSVGRCDCSIGHSI